MTESVEIAVTLNGKRRAMHVDPPELLVEALKDRCGLRGVRVGCETGDCGACTVLMDGRVMKSCLRLAASADGADVVTLEGLEGDDGLHPVQEAFVSQAAFQCGFCLPGMILASVDLLERIPAPERSEIREALSGNLCRCTGYQRMIEAVESLARAESAPGPGTSEGLSGDATQTAGRGADGRGTRGEGPYTT